MRSRDTPAASSLCFCESGALLKRGALHRVPCTLSATPAFQASSSHDTQRDAWPRAGPPATDPSLSTTCSLVGCAIAAPVPSQGRNRLAGLRFFLLLVSLQRMLCHTEASLALSPFLFYPLLHLLFLPLLHYHPCPFATLPLLPVMQHHTQRLSCPSAFRNTTPGNPQTGSAGS